MIVPVYNEERRIGRALESILLQRTEFEVEIIVVDDGSTDGTAAVVTQLAACTPSIKLLRQPERLGKGAAFRRGCEAARGMYFHVLDGDDYFVNFDKLQRQADVLDTDASVFAVAHNCALIYPDGSIEILSDLLAEASFSYEQCMAFEFYFHTSTYMMRKLSVALPIEFETRRGLRGDSACLYYHAFRSKAGVRYLPDVASVYDFHGRGLWSGLPVEARNGLLVELFRDLQQVIVRDPETPEYRMLAAKLESVQSVESRRLASPERRLSANDILEACLTVSARVYDAQVFDRVFRDVYGLRVIDGLCETVGRVLAERSGHKFSNRTFDPQTVAFLVSGLQPRNGGIFAEIFDLVSLHAARGQRVVIVISGLSDTNRGELGGLSKDPLVELQFVPDGSLGERVGAILDILYEAAPWRLYPFVSHHDVVSNAALQKGIAGEIVMDYVYDHGTSMGLWNSSVDKVIFKSRSQIAATSRIVPRRKLILRPTLFRPKANRLAYAPFRNKVLTTASAAARSYKVEMAAEFDYGSVVGDLIAATGGTHIHFGPLSEAYLARITHGLQVRNMNPASFVHVKFADDLTIAFARMGVDIFLMPFPIPSQRIAIEVMSCGIPSLHWNGGSSHGLTCEGFVDPEQWGWREPGDILRIVTTATAADLIQKSKSAVAYFERRHDWEVNSDRLFGLESDAFDIDDSWGATLAGDIVSDEVYDISELTQMLARGHVSLSGAR